MTVFASSLAATRRVADNKLGKSMAQLVNQGFAVDTSLAQSLRAGELLVLADLQTTAFTAAPAAGFLTFGRIAGAISEQDVNDNFYPAIHGSVLELVDASWTGLNPPECGCTTQSAGATDTGKKGTFDLP
jgi:hypothetical protein